MPLKIVNLHITFEDEACTKTILGKFMMVDLPLAYNVIIDRPTPNRLRALVSNYYIMKFPMRIDIRELRSNPRESLHCYLMMISLPKKDQLEMPLMDHRYLAKLILCLELVESLIETLLEKLWCFRKLKSNTQLDLEVY